MNGVLMKNEQEANKVVAKVMRITFLIFVLVYGLNVVGIFVVEKKIMTIAFITGSFFCGCRLSSDESETERQAVLST